MTILLIIVAGLLVMNLLGYKIRIEKPEGTHKRKTVDNEETK